MFCLQARLPLPPFTQFSSILAHLLNTPAPAAPMPSTNPPCIMRLYGNERLRAAAQLSEKQFAREMPAWVPRERKRERQCVHTEDYYQWEEKRVNKPKEVFYDIIFVHFQKGKNCLTLANRTQMLETCISRRNNSDLTL